MRAKPYDCLMSWTFLRRRMEEVLTPKELNLVRSYLGLSAHKAIRAVKAAICHSGQPGIHAAPCAYRSDRHIFWQSEIQVKFRPISKYHSRPCQKTARI